jgi:hypothetical protein
LQNLSQRAAQAAGTRPLLACWRGERNAGFPYGSRDSQIKDVRRWLGLAARPLSGNGHNSFGVRRADPGTDDDIGYTNVIRGHVAIGRLHWTASRIPTHQDSNIQLRIIMVKSGREGLCARTGMAVDGRRQQGPGILLFYKLAAPWCLQTE